MDGYLPDMGRIGTDIYNMYDYADFKPELFKEENQEAFLKIRDGIMATITIAGCISMEKAIGFAKGDSWLRMAMVERLVELGEIEEVKTEYDSFRVFTKFK